MKNQDLLSGGRSSTDIFLDAVCAQAQKGPILPYVLSYSPVSVLNPFQQLLYCSATTAGYALVPTTKFENLSTVSWRNRSVIHLHWVASILKACTNKAHADFCVQQFEKKLENWRALGHKLLWTMHNVLPHESVFLEAEISLRKKIINYSDAIHILSEDSIELASEFYPIKNKKIFHIPHPSYEGWYPNVIDRTSARQHLGLDFNEFIFLAFGSIQRYKGVLELVRAFKIMKINNPTLRLRLVIAGKPVDTEYIHEISVEIEAAASITFIQDPMEDRDIQILFNAADVVVAPYKKTLNSGIALLAATFKKELVAPYSPGIIQTYNADTTLLYTDQPGDELVDALHRSISYKISDKKFVDILKHHRPREISNRFFDAVTSNLMEDTNR
ncbi:glycosyltransferase [Advenella kashmirensis]